MQKLPRYPGTGAPGTCTLQAQDQGDPGVPPSSAPAASTQKLRGELQYVGTPSEVPRGRRDSRAGGLAGGLTRPLSCPDRRSNAVTQSCIGLTQSCIHALFVDLCAAQTVHRFSRSPRNRKHNALRTAWTSSPKSMQQQKSARVPLIHLGSQGVSISCQGLGGMGLTAFYRPARNVTSRRCERGGRPRPAASDQRHGSHILGHGAALCGSHLPMEISWKHLRAQHREPRARRGTANRPPDIDRCAAQIAATTRAARPLSTTKRCSGVL